MILSCVVALNLIVLYSFLFSKKHLHLFEIIVSWTAFAVLQHNFIFITSLNLEWISVSPELDLYWATVCNRLILQTLVQVWFLSAFTAAETRMRKLTLFALTDAILTFIIYLMKHFGMIHFIHWYLWGAFLFWTGSLLIGILILKWFRKLLSSEVLC